jgi:hypothetical protein
MPNGTADKILQSQPAATYHTIKQSSNHMIQAIKQSGSQMRQSSSAAIKRPKQSDEVIRESNDQAVK